MTVALKELAAVMASKGYVTAEEVGRICGCEGAHAIERLRKFKNVSVEIVGHEPPSGRGGRPKKRYKVELIGVRL